MRAFHTAIARAASEPASLRRLPLAVGMAVLWAYIGSIYVYKIWYIAAALGGVLLALAVAAGGIRTRGLVRALLPVLAYFAILLAGVLWAAFPGNTVLWVAIDSIEIAVFAFFFLAGRNAGGRAIARAMVLLLIPALVIAFVMYRINPYVSRLSHYALPLLPLVVPFAFARMSLPRARRWHSVLALVVIFGILIAARSRAPLATAVVLTGLSLIAFRTSTLQVLRRGVAIALMVIVVAGILVALPVTRPMAVTTFVRLSQREVLWGGIYIPAQPPSPTRALIASLNRELMFESQPLGIGYMNFISHYELRNRTEMNLHSLYLTAFTEGGVAGALIVIYLFWRHFSGTRRLIRFAPDQETRAHGRAVLIAGVGVLLLGIFHQIHQSPAMWMVLGLGAACAAQARELERKRAVRGTLGPFAH